MVARGRHFEDLVVLSVYFKRAANSAVRANGISRYLALRIPVWGLSEVCLLYTSDAADDLL